MRLLPFADSSFGGVTSFFTSFGYFDTPDEDRQVLREMRRVLKPGGKFLLDFLNAERVRRDLVEEDVRTIEGGAVKQSRSIQEDSVVKRIHIEPHDGSPPREYEERVRLYAAPDLESVLSSCGLQTVGRFGDYEGTEYSAASPRLILAGHAARASTPGAGATLRLEEN
jgi:SAM-dependent methyltransferase